MYHFPSDKNTQGEPTLEKQDESHPTMDRPPSPGKQDGSRPTMDTPNPEKQDESPPTMDRSQNPEKQDESPTKDKRTIIEVEHSYCLPPGVEEVDHYETVLDNGFSTTDENYAISRMKIPKQAVPLNAMQHITDFEHLIESLNKGCKKCGLKLDLTQALGVLPKGLGGYLYIRCGLCEEICAVKLSKTHKSKSSKSVKHDGIFDLNTKAAVGMLHGGMGERVMNNFLSVLNLNTISTASLKDRESEVGETLEFLADQSQRKWCHEELKQTIEKTPVKRKVSRREQMKFKRCRSAERVPMSKCVRRRPRSTSPNYEKFGMHGSIDTCWQQRRKAMNSMSGASTCMGRNTKKIMIRSLRCKRCRRCFRANKGLKQARPHRCKQNWNGSSKGMEPDMLVDMVGRLKAKGLGLETIAGIPI